MIIKGASRGAGGQLASYLSSQKNERVHVLEISGTSARDLNGALREMDAARHATRSAKALYHAQVSPDREGSMTPEQWRHAADVLGKKLGLDGQPRAVVLHVKDGREHMHIVWSRVDAERGRVISDSKNYRSHEQASRQLEAEFNQKPVQGVHTRQHGLERPARTPERAAMQQGERLGLDARDITAEVQGLYRASDSGRAFAAALVERGYTLARGDRRDVVLVDQAGGVHSLTRRAGVKKAEMEAKMADLNRSDLPALSEVQAGRARAGQHQAEQGRQRQVERQAEQRRDSQARERLYQAYQRDRKAARQASTGPTPDEAKARYAEITRAAQAERQRIMQETRNKDERTIALSIAAYRAVEAREQLRDQLAGERSAARPPTWRAWLDQKARTDQDAARYRDWLDRRDGGDTRQREAEQARQAEQAQQQAREQARITRAVTAARTAVGVGYRIDGRDAVEDRGRQIVVHRTNDRQAVALGLALYVQQHGSTVRMTGSDAFKRNAATIAAERGMKVTFADRAAQQVYEARRAELAAERQAARAIQPGRTARLDRDTGRPPVTPILTIAGPSPAQIAAQQERERQQQQERRR